MGELCVWAMLFLQRDPLGLCCVVVVGCSIRSTGVEREAGSAISKHLFRFGSESRSRYTRREALLMRDLVQERLFLPLNSYAVPTLLEMHKQPRLAGLVRRCVPANRVAKSAGRIPPLQ